MSVNAIANLGQLVDYVTDVINKVDADSLANKKSTQFNQDPNRSNAIGAVINSAIIEIANPLPLVGNAGVKQIYTTYYINETGGSFNLIRHTTPNKSMTTNLIEEELAIRNEIGAKTREVVSGIESIFQYDRLFSELFNRIINDFQGLGGNTVGLLDKALIRKCKFVRVDKGTLSVGYSPLDKKYIVRYNPKFCIDATVDYFVNPVLDESGKYRSPIVSDSNILYPIMFFLSHEFAHVLYRHVTNSDTSLQNDLPHYVKQYFGDAYINNSIPYLLGADYGRTNSGDQSEIYTPKAHHPIGINEQVPVDNYLKESYVNEIYKTLQGQDVSAIDNNILANLKKYIDIGNTINVKSSISDDLGYASVQEFEDAISALPSDVKKKIFRSHVKFFTGNFYDIMSRLFPKGYSSNSYMRVLKAILESLFEDIQETETATKKTPPPPPPEASDSQDSQQDDDTDGDESEDGGSGEGGSGEGGGQSGGDSSDPSSDDSSNKDSGGEGDEQESDSEGEGTGDSTDGDSVEGDGQSTDGDPTEGGDSEGGSGSETGDSEGGESDGGNRNKYEVGDYVQQVSTGKIGRITAIEPDGTYVIDTSQVLEESLGFFDKLKLLFESVIRVGEDDLVPYQASNQNDKSGAQDDQSNPSSSNQSDPHQATPDQDPSEEGEGQQGDEGESDGSRDVSSQGSGDDDGGAGSNAGGAPTLDQDSMDDQGQSGEGGDGEGDGSSGPDDFPSLPPEDSPDSDHQQSNGGQSQSGSPEGGSADNQHNGSDMEGGSGEGGVSTRSDGLDELRRQLDEAHEDAKTGMSERTSEYLEEDEETREEADRELDDDDAKEEVSKSIQETVQEAQKDGKDIDEILKGVDKDEINNAFEVDINKRPRQVSSAKWKQMFRELISLASGYKIERDNARPSRKVEGLWGANKKVPSIKDVVILLDCSSSMSSPMFKAIFAELQQLGKLPELKDTWIHLIPWGSEATYKRYKGLSKPSVKQMYQFGRVDLGGTYIAYGYDMMMKKVRNPDLVIILTDSEYSDYREWKSSGKMSTSWYSRRNDAVDIDKVMAYMKRVARKTVIVSIDKKESHKNEMIAKDYRRRLLEIDTSISTSGGDDLDD